MHLKNSHARYARHAADWLGWRFTVLDGLDGYLFEVSDGRRARVFMSGPGTTYVENSAAAYCIARDKHFTALALARAGVPCIPGRLYFLNPLQRAWRSGGQEIEDLMRDAASFSYPLFCKPNTGCRGEFAEQVDDAQALADYVQRVATVHDTLLVQPVQRGREYRVFVQGGQALFCYRKPATTEDADHAAVAGASPRAAPRNRARGGASADLSTEVPFDLADCALAAAAALGLNLAGIDLFADAAGVRVLEVNANPMIETLEDWGRWDLIEAIWTRNLRAALA